MNAVYTSLRLPKETADRLDERIKYLKETHPEVSPTKTSIIAYALKKYLDETEVTS